MRTPARLTERRMSRHPAGKLGALGGALLFRMTCICTSIALLSACTPPSLENVYDQTGDKVEVVYLVSQPLCLFLCAQTTSTTGSDSDVIGTGSTSNTQTSTASSGVSTP